MQIANGLTKKYIKNTHKLHYFHITFQDTDKLTVESLFSPDREVSSRVNNTREETSDKGSIRITTFFASYYSFEAAKRDSYFFIDSEEVEIRNPHTNEVSPRIKISTLDEDTQRKMRNVGILPKLPIQWSIHPNNKSVLQRHNPNTDKTNNMIAYELIYGIRQENDRFGWGKEIKNCGIDIDAFFENADTSLRVSRTIDDE